VAVTVNGAVHQVSADRAGEFFAAEIAPKA
jgi:hypothetical protein